jgi:hypothetical protein
MLAWKEPAGVANVQAGLVRPNIASNLQPLSEVL